MYLHYFNLINLKTTFRCTWGESLIAKSGDSVAAKTNTFWIGTLNKKSLGNLNEMEKVALTVIVSVLY